ncbi:hypothetical protein PBY51_017019 [Eleginops maclovinus]|uniref:Uncharacterized protein n=1 Tax=Eleginops maclovinus TaxID=56733 RepID=A0AAN7WVE2_ELEMC|nr:hypothetical protein PBY51_017019 [Eleginops maclovinus]
MTQVQRLAPALRRQPVCVSVVSANLQGTRVHIVRRRTASCMPVTRKTRQKGFPSSQGNHDMKCCSCQGP